MNEAKNASAYLRWLLVLLFLLPAVMILIKTPGLPTADFLREHASLAEFPDRLQHKLGHILFVPLGALLVVFARLTLGLRVLGPFRSILLAVSFQVTGLVLGLLFLVTTIVAVVGIRHALRQFRLPYFGRITVMLSAVAGLMTVGVMASEWFEWQLLQTLAYFPIVVLCLVADAFARTMNKEGMRSAVWRGTVTVLIAVALAGLAGIPLMAELMIRYPELLMVQIGGILIVSRYCSWKLLEPWNPKVGEDEEDEYEREEFFVQPAKKPAVLTQPAMTVAKCEPKRNADLTAAAETEPSIGQISA